jgi:hypothetical protein
MKRVLVVCLVFLKVSIVFHQPTSVTINVR